MTYTLIYKHSTMGVKVWCLSWKQTRKTVNWLIGSKTNVSCFVIQNRKRVCAAVNVVRGWEVTQGKTVNYVSTCQVDQQIYEIIYLPDWITKNILNIETEMQLIWLI